VARRGADDAVREFVRPGPERMMEAIERLVGGSRQRARRFVEHVTERGTSLDQLWCSLDEHGRVVASALGVANPGRTAMIFVSPPTDVTRAHASALTAHLCGELGRNGAALAQALLPEDASVERAVLNDAGFLDLTVLISMERRLPRRSEIRSEFDAPALPPGVAIEPWDPDDRALLISVLDASYEETLDCPGLCGLRRTEDILDGHLHSGRLERTLWSILHVDGVACGAILLSPNGGDAIELVYLGLARSVRGRGLGRRLLLHGLAALVGRHERVICLAVDERNAPATRLYGSFGFRPLQRRLALIRPL